MPHGALTPLGRQLRSVLFALRPTTCARSYETSHQPNPRQRHKDDQNGAQGGRIRAYHATASPRAAATASAVASSDNGYQAQEDSDALSYSKDDTLRPPGRQRRHAWHGYHLSKALRDAGKVYAVPEMVKRKHDLSRFNTRDLNGRLAYLLRQSELVSSKTHLAQDKALDLARLTASYIAHTHAVLDTGEAEWSTRFKLDPEEDAFLRDRGYTLADIHDWATVIKAEARNDAAQALKVLIDRYAADGKSVPLFVLHYLLRRPYINPRALRALIQQSLRLLEARRTLGRPSRRYVTENAVFIIFVRLLRHAREVSASAIPDISDLLLTYLPQVYSAQGAFRPRQIKNITFLLNKAMQLISLETAVQPFKDVEYQETAIVQILRYMSEHQPVLQLSREGYRAVVRIQLAQRKTKEEQQWAELKALSWPPWKQERTAMDADITADQHGLSRAADTLRRMREAGYAPRQWEEAAGLYAGWDSDGTPTIQTRAFLPPGGGSMRNGTAAWAARVSCTRTAQEAWAAYLAYEDAKLPPSQAVYLAIFKRLQAEEIRSRQEPAKPERMRAKSGVRTPVLPGDSREAEPLPPSTHLYTYTRTPVPTVEAFFHQLQDRKVRLGVRCLAFIVGHATSLQLGFQYLYSGCASHPSIDGLLSPRPSKDISTVPLQLFTAFISLLCRFSHVPLSKTKGLGFTPPGGAHAIPSMPVLDGVANNFRHPLVLAIQLLERRRTARRSPWTPVLRTSAAITKLSSLSSMVNGRAQYRPQMGSEVDRQEGGALVAYRVVQCVLSLVHQLDIDLDDKDIHYLCLIAQNLTIISWRIVSRDVAQFPSGHIEEFQGREPVLDVLRLVQHSFGVDSVKRCFRILVKGDEKDGLATPAALQSDEGAHTSMFSAKVVSRLLHVPSTAKLHSYIRALGWVADYDGLLELVEWMVDHRAELAHQQSTERNGVDMMRRSLCAIRVFMERSWMNGTQHVAAQESEDMAESPQADSRVTLLRKLEAAAPVAMLREVQKMVDGVEEWNGWPNDTEISQYCSDDTFEEIRNLRQ